MTAKTLEQEAREAAIDHGMWLAPDDDETNYEAFVAGYYRGWSDKGVEIEKADLAAATARDKEIEELKLACRGWERSAAESESVALACEGKIARQEPQIAALRSRVAELEGNAPRWARGLERNRLEKLGWLVAGGEMVWHRSPGDVEASWHCLMVPPIPLPEGEP